MTKAGIHTPSLWKTLLIISASVNFRCSQTHQNGCLSFVALLLNFSKKDSVSPGVGRSRAASAERPVAEGHLPEETQTSAKQLVLRAASPRDHWEEPHPAERAGLTLRLPPGF